MEILVPVNELAIPRAHTGLENRGHHRLANDWVSGISTKDEYEYPYDDGPVIVFCQAELVLPTVIPKYVSEDGVDDPQLVIC